MLKTTTTRVFVSLLGALSLFVIVPAHTQSSLDSKSAALLASRFGISTARLWLDHAGIDIPSSTLAPEEQSAEIENALRRYKAVRDDYAGIVTAASGVQAVVGATIGGAILYSGPQAAVTVPLMLLGAASHVSLDMAKDKIKKIERERTISLLAQMKDDLVREAEVESFNALTADPELLRDTVIVTNRFLMDVKRRALESGDQRLVNTAVEMIQSVATEIDAATLELVAQRGGDINTVDREFGEFVQATHKSNERTNDRLDQYNDFLNNIGSQLDNFGSDVTEVNMQVQRLDRKQNLLVDFMFSGLPPDEKVTALRSGLIDDKIHCPDGSNSGCDLGKVRATLIKLYEDEAKIKNNVVAAGRIIQNIRYTQSILDDLDIDIGTDGENILETSASIADAYINFMGANYLGAVASISSLFGNRSGELDAVLENQRLILDAVKKIEKKLDLIYKNLDGRLESMEWEQNRISVNLRELMWENWMPCFSVYSYALAPNAAKGDPPFVNPNTLRFESFEGLRAVIKARGDQILDCRSTVIPALDSMKATRWFGAFLDARRALDINSFIDLSTLSGEHANELNEWRTDTQRYLEDVVKPAASISNRWAEDNNVSASTLLNLQTSHISNVDQLRSTIDAIKEGHHFGCNGAEVTGRVTRSLICIPSENSDTIAKELMGLTINGDFLLEIADWLEILSQTIDLYDTEKKRFAASLNELVAFPTYSLGEEITRKTIDMIALAIAHYSRTYGGITALALAEDILSGAVDETVLSGVAEETQHPRRLADPYLAENTALLLLHMKRKTWNLQVPPSRPTFENIYTQALVHALSETTHRFEPLYALFGREHSFEIDKDEVGLKVQIGKTVAFLPLPPPIRQSNGQFVFPPRYFALIARQNRLVNTYLDYDLGSLSELALIALQR